MSSFPVNVGAKGRVVLPAPIRHALGLVEGSELLARVEDGAVVLEPRSVAVDRLRALVRASVPKQARLVDELLAERRAEARRERRR
jgi:AbrB family looped-hinge helix DNA binding protein